jgi:hypothetical protein
MDSVDASLARDAETPCSSIAVAADLLRRALNAEGHFLEGHVEPGMPDRFRLAEQIYRNVLEFLVARSET